MKNFYVLILAIIFPISSLSFKIDKTPVNVFNNCILVNNNNIIIGCDNGTVKYSFDEGINWETEKICKDSLITNIISKDSSFIIFGSNGSIISVDSNFKKFSKIKTLKLSSFDTILTVAYFGRDYYVRTKNKLYLLDSFYRLQDSINLTSKFLPPNIYRFQYNKSITFFNNKILLIIDSLKVLAISEDFRQIDTIDLKTIINTQYKNSNYIHFSNNQYYFFVVKNILYKTDDFANAEVIDTLDDTKTNNLKILNDTLFNAIYSNFSKTRNNNFFKVKLFKYTDRFENVSSLSCNDFLPKKLQISDYYCINSKLFIIGHNSLITNNNFTDSILNIQNITHLKINDTGPFLIDSTIYHIEQYAYSTNQSLLTSTNFGTTFKPYDKISDNEEFYKIFNMTFCYIDSINRNIFFIGKYKEQYLGFSYSLNSKILFKKQIKEMNNLTYSGHTHFPGVSNLYKSGKYLMLSNKSIQSTFFILDTNFNFINKFLDTNYLNGEIIFWDGDDALTNLAYSNNRKTVLIKTTMDLGKNWDIIKEFTVNDTVINYQQFNFKDSLYYTIITYNWIDSIYSFNIFNINNFYFSTILRFKHQLFNDINYLPLSFCTFNDTILITFKDTIYLIDDLYTKDNWKKINIPNKGQIYIYNKKIGNKFFATYSDRESQFSTYWLTFDFKEPDPPFIIAFDNDFDTLDLGKSHSIIDTVFVFNDSPESKLILYNATFTKDSNFTFVDYNKDSLGIEINPKSVAQIPIKFEGDSTGYYSDSLIFHSNANVIDSVSILTINVVDTSTPVEESTEKIFDYLYTYPPYPTPSTDYVNVLTYFDITQPFDLSKVYVTDIYGARVSTDSELSFEPQTNYKGVITWDCSSHPDGVYFIIISHGTTKKAVKVMVGK